MSLKERIKNIYFKLVRSDDTPHRIALGFAIGIFYGFAPFVGVIFTLLTAFILRANKISALAGCFVTNTWMTVFLIPPSVKLGFRIFGPDWRFIRFVPPLVGFVIIALAIAAASYFISLFFIIKYRNRRRYAEDIRP